MSRDGRLLFIVDLAGIFIFAVEGALAAIGARLDLLGILVLCFATALAGGVARDLLLGAIPPLAIRDWRYAATAFLAGALMFFLHRAVAQIPTPVFIVIDAAGLALFAVAGTEKALIYGVSPFVAALLGTVTAVGGGTVRDVLLAQIPVVLRTDIYATAALAGAVVMILARRFGLLSPTWGSLLGGAVCFALRLIAVWQHWNLPRALGT